MQKRIFLYTLIILLGACVAGKKYERPAVELPRSFNNDIAPSDTSVAGMQWRKFFSDSTLVHLIDSALQGNFDLQLAMRRIDEANEYVKQARANYLPTLDAQLSASINIPSKNSLNGKSLESFIGKKHLEDYTLSVSASWEADVWGKIKRQKEAALANYMQTYDAARAVQTTLIANVAESYFNLLMLDLQLKIAQRNLYLSDTLVQMMNLQKQAGQVTQLAVEQTAVQQQTAALLVPQLQQQILIQENNIRILSGQFPGSIEHSLQLNDVYLPDSLSAGVPADLLSRRPDVRATEMALVTANANVGVAQAQMYPSFNITASGGINAFKASQWFEIPASLFGIGTASVLQPILEHRHLKTNYEVAKVQREQAVISFRQSVLNATGEVANALVQVNKLREQKTIAAQQVDTLHKAVFNAQLLFISGLADYLEVITAQSNSLNAELNLALIQRQELSAKVELYRALGGGWN